MVKKFKELVCELDDGQIALRFKKSEAFLSDENVELDLGGKNAWSIWICRVLFWLGLITLIGLLAMAFYIWMWDSSPLTSTVEADVTGLNKKSQGAEVQYKFVADGTEYSATQYSNSSRSKWSEANAKAEVIYLNFMPSSNKLKVTAERMDWSMLLLGPILPLGFIIGGVLGKREVERMVRIENNASHVLSGEVTRRINSKGTVIVQYKTHSPESGSEIFGGVQLGKLEPALSNMQIGSKVAVAYANDKEHTLL